MSKSSFLPSFNHPCQHLKWNGLDGAGREGREFGAAAARKKQKTGGLSNKQKEKAKPMPAHVRIKQISRRAAKHKRASKGFKGRVKKPRW